MSSPVSPVVAARLVWAATLLRRPGVLLRMCPEAGAEERHRGSLVLRALALRHIAQALVTAAAPVRPVRAVGAGADTLHALSALLLASRSRVWRRGAALDSAVALAFAFATAPGRRAPVTGGGR